LNDQVETKKQRLIHEKLLELEEQQDMDYRIKEATLE
jgi:hypothetical protein